MKQSASIPKHREMVQVTVRDRRLGMGVEQAYRLLGVLPGAHPLVIAKARTALLALSGSDKRDREIEAAYLVVCRHQLVGKGNQT